VGERIYTDAEIDTAVAALVGGERLGDAQELVARAAPQLQSVLDQALAEGGWFDAAHEQAVRETTGEDDPELRLRGVRTLIAEETRISMLVGVAVGFELAHELGTITDDTTRRED
jgi:hypothetical protein